MQDIKVYWQKLRDSLWRQKIRRWRLLFVAIPLLLSLSAVWWYFWMLSPANPKRLDTVSFEITRGMTAKTIGESLKKEGLIKNSLIFLIYTKINRLDTKFKSGCYRLNYAMSLPEMVDKFVKGEVALKKVTIPEGLTLEKIAEVFESNGLAAKEEFLRLAVPSLFEDKYPFLKTLPAGATLEGFLFPDTYYLPEDSPVSLYIDAMIKRFYDVYYRNGEFLEKEKKLGLNTYQVITLASIVEREAKLNSEKPVIAAVFLNRLKKGMPLQSCATVEYVLKEHKEVLTLEDLKIESPYNTYINSGLPPGPISSPGMESIKAVLNPADVDYLYFVANKDGSHTFSKTYEEHLKAKKESEQKR
ncbi:endolytic transglycosylase MltG [Fervidicola ferrireducens]|uniref:endolytic transglycosylase MltG n=1 Tax=Fervidicola ferrireducens TaxID=520764 RepID=UPI00082B74DA|nr:endolytic transglycosylase MltG [Fervidicola ferrireducens]